MGKKCNALTRFLALLCPSKFSKIIFYLVSLVSNSQLLQISQFMEIIQQQIADLTHTILRISENETQLQQQWNLLVCFMLSLPRT